MKTLYCSKYPSDCLRIADNVIAVESSKLRLRDDLFKLGFENRGNYFYLPLEDFIKKSADVKSLLRIEDEQFHDFISTNDTPMLNVHGSLSQIINNMKLPLLNYQMENVNYALHYNYFIIGDSMGLGKTPSALAIASICKKTIVISPAFLKINWYREVQKFTNLSVSPILSVKELTKQRENLNYDVLLINYEIIEKVEFLFENVELIICDEFHKIANDESKMSKALYRVLLKYKPNRFLGLSGTAVNNRVGEFFNPLRLISLSPIDCGLRIQTDHRFNIKYNFERFFSFENHKKPNTFFGLRNYKDLKKLLDKKYIRHTIEENLPDMPDIRRIEIDAGEYEAQLAQELGSCFERAQGDDKPNEAKYLMTIKREAAESKIAVTFEFIKELLETEEKIIVFSDHRNPVIELCELLKQFNPVMIIGGMAIDLRQQAVDAFQFGNARLLIATIGSASTGLTLTSSHICVFNDLPWVPAQLLQAEGRVRRIGQKSNCISYIMSKSKIDRVILSTLIKKAKILNAVLSDNKENLFIVEKNGSIQINAQ